MAGWWDRTVVPRLIRCGCSMPEFTELRMLVVPKAQGNVLELGVGSGANLTLYDPANVHSVTAIDPSRELLAMAGDAVRGAPVPVTLEQASGEALPYADGTFDTVLTTFTLCSVADPSRVLREARRVLKPGGRILFLEHGRSPDPGPARWQQRIEPVWKRLTGNCHLHRAHRETAQACGLLLRNADCFYLPRKPRWLGFIEWGEAQCA